MALCIGKRVKKLLRGALRITNTGRTASSGVAAAGKTRRVIRPLAEEADKS